MVTTISKDTACKILQIPDLTYINFSLLWTDMEDTENIVNLCHGRMDILEVGTYLGHTTENIAKYNPHAKITTIDICKDLVSELKHQNNEILDRSDSGKMITCKNVVKKITTSDDFFKLNMDKFDVIFIDGDHSYEQVQKDTENALKCLKENGIIIWHDVYNNDGLCRKCLAEPPHNDVRDYLEKIPQEVFKIDRSWVAFYVS